MSDDELLLAIDAGTGSCRAVLFDSRGHQLAIGQREYSHHELPGAPGSQVFDTATHWELVCACTREALAGVRPDAVKAVSATSMREGMVLYDSRGDRFSLQGFTAGYTSAPGYTQWTWTSAAIGLP